MSSTLGTILEAFSELMKKVGFLSLNRFEFLMMVISSGCYQDGCDRYNKSSTLGGSQLRIGVTRGSRLQV
jgi:hypothetical protein